MNLRFRAKSKVIAPIAHYPRCLAYFTKPKSFNNVISQFDFVGVFFRRVC